MLSLYSVSLLHTNAAFCKSELNFHHSHLWRRSDEFIWPLIDFWILEFFSRWTYCSDIVAESCAVKEFVLLMRLCLCRET